MPHYKFIGRVVKLDDEDYETWKRVYFAIPDLDAELRRIDDEFREAQPSRWFCAASAKLAAKHQRFLREGAKECRLCGSADEWHLPDGKACIERQRAK